MSVEARLRVIESEREILRTLYQYGHALDYGPESEFLDVFTESACWIGTGRASQGYRFEGRNGLVKLFRHHAHAPEIYLKHLLIEPRITVDETTASVASYFVRIDEHPDGPFIRVFGRYLDQLLECPDGRWRIEERICESESSMSRAFPPSDWQGLPLVVR
jgi:hypothetical protein